MRVRPWGPVPSSMPPVGSASRKAASGRPRSLIGRAASTSCSSTASRTLRVMAQAVSKLNDSGTQPSVEVRACVFLNPTSPCSAAGTRIEPRVSEPSAAQAAPQATDDRAARGRTAGNARRGVQRQCAGIRGRAVVRIDADAGEGELGQVRMADQCGAGGAQARNGGTIGDRGHRIGHRFRCCRGGCAGHVEQVLDRHRQSPQRRDRRASAALGIDGRGRGTGHGVEAAHESVAARRSIRRLDRVFELVAGQTRAAGHLGHCLRQVQRVATC